jgi:uncharacterized protein YegL
MRRLPIFFLLDISESMVGDNHRQMQQGLERLVKSLRTDPHALETVYLSVIAFAGEARTLAPLTELAMFYPPRLPIGAGTSLGAALEHLMNDIKQFVIKTTPERKGDWRPIVYLMTDGKPTDDVTPSLNRWKKEFAASVTLVAIGIGKYASLDILQQLTEHLLHLDATTDEDFRKFIDWVTMSVVAQSRSLSATTKGVNLAKLDTDILSMVNDISKANTIDEDFVILNGRCQKTKLPYLIKYERSLPNFENTRIQMGKAHYFLSGVFALEQDYFELSDSRCLTRTINSDELLGAPGCPHCGNPIGFAMCRCGQIMCIRGEGPATCPSCQQACNFAQSDGDGFDVARGRG